MAVSYKDNRGVSHDFEASIKAVKNLALANAEQLLYIGLSASDEHIDKRFGGEDGLLELIIGYIDLYFALIDREVVTNELQS